MSDSDRALEPPTYTWTADRGAAWSAAYAMTVLDMRGPRYRLFTVVATIGPPGLVLTMQLFRDHLDLCRQWAATSVEFRAYIRLEIVDDWVFLRQRRRRVRASYPQARVPPSDLARVRLTTLGLVTEDDQ